MEDDGQKISPEVGIESREEFLSGFTRDDEKRIMRKVDKRFLILIGTIYLMKTVSSTYIHND